jgi:hypothetical protein
MGMLAHGHWPACLVDVDDLRTPVYLKRYLPALQVFSEFLPSFCLEGGQVTGGHRMRQETIPAMAAGLSKFLDGAPVDRIHGLPSKYLRKNNRHF